MLPTVVGILAAVVGLHLLLTFSLIARVRTLQDMLGGGAVADLPAPGTAIGTFETATLEGEKLSDALLRDQTILVGFFSPGCGPCKRACGELLASPPELPLLAFVGGNTSDPDTQTLVTTLGQVSTRVAYTAIDDPVYRAFRPTGYPSLFRVENGQIAAAGHSLRDVLQ